MSTKSSPMTYDAVVVGGGAAGMFAAITAAQGGARVLLLERGDRLGRKLLITGKGRCNLTNNCSVQEVLQNVPRNARFLTSAMYAFPPEAAMAFFTSRGCPLKTERGNRVFPVSDSAHSVLSCLLDALSDARVARAQGRAEEILTRDGAVCGVRTRGASYAAGAVVLATGGMSYPATGSTGDGYALARRLGHTIAAPDGSLVPLCAAGGDCAHLDGLTLRNVGVKLLSGDGKRLYDGFGELLFTPFGVSGPTVLRASAHAPHAPCSLVIDLKPALDAPTLDARLLRDLSLYRSRTMRDALADLLPRAMIPVVLERAGVASGLPAGSLRREQRLALAAQIKALRFDITGKRPISEAIVTRGGVCTAEIDPRTMRSRLVGGLYFAGEIIDCDAYTGGFNLQIAWATAYAAGNALKTGIDKKRIM